MSLKENTVVWHLFVNLFMFISPAACTKTFFDMIHTRKTKHRRRRIELSEAFPAAACCQASVIHKMLKHCSDMRQWWWCDMHLKTSSCWKWCPLLFTGEHCTPVLGVVQLLAYVHLLNLAFPMRWPQRTHWPRSTWCGSPISPCSFLQRKETKAVLKLLKMKFLQFKAVACWSTGTGSPSSYTDYISVWDSSTDSCTD